MKISSSIANADHVIRMARKHEHGGFNHVDAAIISILGHSYLDLLDLSMIRVHHLIKSSGKLVDVCQYTGTTKTKVLRVDGYVRDILEMTVERRINKGHGITNSSEYRGLDPDSRFFLDADGSEFVLRKRHKGTALFYEPEGLRRRFKSYVLPAGWTANTLNDSFLQGLWRVVAVTKPSAAIKVLEETTGLTAKTIKQKVYEEPMSVHEALALIY